MSKYLLHYNQYQDKELESLKSKNDQLVCDTNSFYSSIESLCNLIRELENENFNAQIWRDHFLGSLARINLATINFNKIPFETNAKYHDLRMTWCLVFFQNSKAFLEIVKSNFPKFSLDKYKILIKDITSIRNYFAHDYKKDYLDNDCVVRIDYNHQFNNGLIKLKLMDFKTSEEINDIYFSLSAFFNDIKKLLEELIIFIEDKKVRR